MSEASAPGCPGGPAGPCVPSWPAEPEHAIVASRLASKMPLQDCDRLPQVSNLESMTPPICAEVIASAMPYRFMMSLSSFAHFIKEETAARLAVPDPPNALKWRVDERGATYRPAHRHLSCSFAPSMRTVYLYSAPKA